MCPYFYASDEKTQKNRTQYTMNMNYFGYIMELYKHIRKKR